MNNRCGLVRTSDIHCNHIMIYFFSVYVGDVNIDIKKIWERSFLFPLFFVRPLMLLLCSFRKNPYSRHRRDWNFLGDGGFCKAKKVKKCIELWNFREGGMDIFWNYTL